MTDRKQIYCLDFDGVIHSYSSGWKGADVIPDPPVAGAIEHLYHAIYHFDVQIFSSRSNQPGGIAAMQAWLAHWEGRYRDKLAAMGVPLQRTCLVFNIKFPTEKPPAFIGLDDRVLTFTGRWPTMDELKGFRPWNKREASTPSPYDSMEGPELLEHCGASAIKWAAAFRATARKLGYSDMDENWLATWFANAIEHSYQVRQRPWA